MLKEHEISTSIIGVGIQKYAQVIKSQNQFAIEGSGSWTLQAAWTTISTTKTKWSGFAPVFQRASVYSIIN